jgi:hypothetical protein
MTWKIKNENKWNHSECIPKEGWALIGSPLSQFIDCMNQEVKNNLNEV